MIDTDHHIEAGNKYMNKIMLVHGGKEYFDVLLQLIDQATWSIHLQAYIFDDDETGVLVANALKAAARRNVEVYLLADGYASQTLPGVFINELKDAGVHFRFFEPLFRSRYFYFGRRMHHKIVVTDARSALVGGLNIADRYNDFPGKPAWFDLALHIEGPVAVELCVLCWKAWFGFPLKLDTTPCEKKLISFDFKNQELSRLLVRRNDWVRRKNEISATYIKMLREAKSHVTILCSYFLPGKVIRRLLSNAAKRGVKIKIITAGISDVKVAKNAERWMYDWLLRNGIELYEYQSAVLHAKVAVCDGEWVTIGSYNVNNISAYASIELNIDVFNKNFSKDMDQLFHKIILNDCIKITEEKHKHSTNIFNQFIRWCSYQGIRLIFYLFTFYFKRQKITRKNDQ
ncbi:phospholipase D-like domain-containing protein [Ferruginibacter profundus]